MEFFLCRALEVARLDQIQFQNLHETEQTEKRCLMPGEIQARYWLPSLKVHYGVPPMIGRREREVARRHWNRCAARIKRARLLENLGPITEFNVGSVHHFDFRVRMAVNRGQICFMRRASFGDPDFYRPRQIHDGRLAAAGE